MRIVRISRRIVVLLALGLAATSCSAGAGGDERATAVEETSTTTGSDTVAVRSTSFAVDQVASTPPERVTEALVISMIEDVSTEIRFEHPDFGPPKVRSGDLKRGGPPPDGIPSIDHPRFHRIADVDFLRDNEPVFVLEIDGDARAYPLQIMMWHEIVNDTVGGVPVAVTYCPLCNSAFAHDRRVGERVLEFGVSGALWNSSLVMFDRQTHSLWSHFTGEGLLGVLAGTQLRGFPVALASWKEFRTAHRDGLVLSRDTGFLKDYGRNPYPGYDDVNNPPFLFDGEVDGRYPAKTRVIGLELPSGPVAVIAQRLTREGVVTIEDAGRTVVVWWQPGTGSALDAERVADGRDVGTTAAYATSVDGRALTFRPVAGGGFADAETGSTWNVFGEATAGPLAGRRLAPVEHVDTFWFAWGAFQPASTVIG